MVRQKVNPKKPEERKSLHRATAVSRKPDKVGHDERIGQKGRQQNGYRNHLDQGRDSAKQVRRKNGDEDALKGGESQRHEQRAAVDSRQMPEEICPDGSVPAKRGHQRGDEIRADREYPQEE